MESSFANREVSRNAEFRDLGLKWMFALSHALGMAEKLHVHLRAHRKARGLTLEQVANKIGIKENTLSDWERGKRGVDLNDLEKLAKVYGVHPAALLLAPEEGPRFEAMRRASSIAERMGPEVAEDWLKMGERLAPKPPDE